MNTAVDYFVYVGGNGIERFSFNLATGALTSLGKQAASGTSFLAHHPNGKTLYAVNDGAAQVQAFSIASGTGNLTAKSKHPTMGAAAVHVSTHPSGKWLFVSNYTGGNVSVFPIKADGDIGSAVDTKSSGESSHQIMPDPAGNFVFVPCRGEKANWVAQFSFNAETGKLTPNNPATVASDDPRHIAFHPTGKWAYLLNEEPAGGAPANVVTFKYDADTGKLTPGDMPNKLTLMAGETHASHIMVTPNGKFVFAGGRKTQRVFGFSVNETTGVLTAAGSAQGVGTARGFSMDPTGQYLVVADQSAGKLVVLKIGNDGALTKVGATINTVAGAQTVAIVPVPKP